MILHLIRAYVEFKFGVVNYNNDLAIVKCWSFPDTQLKIQKYSV